MATTAARIKPFRPTGLLTPHPIAGRWRNAARIGFGGFFLAMAAYNATVVLPDAAEAYRGVAELSWPRLQLLWQPTFLRPQLGHAPTPTGPGPPGPADQKPECWSL